MVTNQVNIPSCIALVAERGHSTPKSISCINLTVKMSDFPTTNVFVVFRHNPATVTWLPAQRRWWTGWCPKELFTFSDELTTFFSYIKATIKWSRCREFRHNLWLHFWELACCPSLRTVYGSLCVCVYIFIYLCNLCICMCVEVPLSSRVDSLQDKLLSLLLSLSMFTPLLPARPSPLVTIDERSLTMAMVSKVFDGLVV